VVEGEENPGEDPGPTRGIEEPGGGPPTVGAEAVGEVHAGYGKDVDEAGEEEKSRPPAAK